MNMIDVNKNMGEDAPEGYSSEGYCKTLHEYHKELWSKGLPNEKNLELVVPEPDFRDAEQHKYSLVAESIGLILTSDVLNTGWNDEWGLGGEYKSLKEIRAGLQNDETEHYKKTIRTIGNYIVFPKGRGNKPPYLYEAKKDFTWGVNRARGLDKKICDRFDLTLECIRLWYECADKLDAQKNPLIEAMKFSKDFFKLFGTGHEGFMEYVKFFLLDDLVDADYKDVEFFMPFNGFDSVSPLPETTQDFRELMHKACLFIEKRNKRIDEYTG